MKNPIYIGYYFEITPLQPASEILIAELGEAGFESFVETETGIKAFIQKKTWSKNILENIFILKSGEFLITHTFEEIEQINWNEEWEKNFSPILVDDICTVRAPFHPKTNTEFDIVIEPKMSFGTGHHETTHMMLMHILKNNMDQKRVLDIGCGTGVLAILAMLKGATQVDAIDIDNWCYLNSVENAAQNGCNNIQVFEGDVGLIKGKKYDVILANINRNILVKDISKYAETLEFGGTLYVSGFYQEDLVMITACCEESQLHFIEKFERNNWIAASYKKK